MAGTNVKGLDNLNKISNYIEMLTLTEKVWVVDSAEKLFINCDMSAYEDFYGAGLVNIKDFIQKVSLFTLSDATIQMRSDYLEISQSDRNMKYPFSNYEINNDTLINDASGDSVVIGDFIPPKIEKLKQLKKFTVKLVDGQYKELTKLASAFKSADEAFRFIGENGKLYFYSTQPNGTDFKLEIGLIPFEDFKSFEFALPQQVHDDDWAVTFFDDKAFILWESLTTDFNILMQCKAL